MRRRPRRQPPSLQEAAPDGETPELAARSAGRGPAVMPGDKGSRRARRQVPRRRCRRNGRGAASLTRLRSEQINTLETLSCFRSYVARWRVRPCTAVEWERSPVASPAPGPFFDRRPYSFIALQLPLSPMRVFLIGIEHAGFVAVDRLQNSDTCVHDRPAAGPGE